MTFCYQFIHGNGIVVSYGDNIKDAMRKITVDVPPMPWWSDDPSCKTDPIPYAVGQSMEWNKAMRVRLSLVRLAQRLLDSPAPAVWEMEGTVLALRETKGDPGWADALEARLHAMIANPVGE